MSCADAEAQSGHMKKPLEGEEIAFGRRLFSLSPLALKATTSPRRLSMRLSCAINPGHQMIPASPCRLRGEGRGEGLTRESELVATPPHPDFLHSPSKTGVNALMASGEKEHERSGYMRLPLPTRERAALRHMRNRGRKVRTAR
jgi:hypothetical protein